MGYDYWHQSRILRLRDAPEDLDFGSPPLVVGPVVTMPEPIWRTVAFTALRHGVGKDLPSWSWDSPLPARRARAVGHALGRVAESVEQTGAIEFPLELASDSLPDQTSVLAALRIVTTLLYRAADERRDVEIWVE